MIDGRQFRPVVRRRTTRAVGARVTAAALLAAAALAIAACDDDEESATRAPQPAATAVSKDLTKKPEIPKPTGAPPSQLVVRDIVEGKGRTVRVDDSVKVHYVGVLHATGQQFDASWDSGSPARFQLSEGRLIPGWIEGIPGMKVGGRRMLVIPPDLGYGAQGQPPVIGPNETLVFVIDMVGVG